MRGCGRIVLVVLFLILLMLGRCCVSEGAVMVEGELSRMRYLYDLAYNAGFRGDDVPVAVAIAMAESGGVPDRLGDVALMTDKWGPSVGLWQVRSLNAERGTGGIRDQDILSDPVQNARSAFAIMKERGGFEPWTMFNNGGYLQYMRAALDARNVARSTLSDGERASALQSWAM